MFGGLRVKLKSKILLKKNANTWKGFREVLVSPPSVVIRGDRGTAYPSVIETKNDKIVFVSGQGEERAIVSFDLKWLEEKTAKDDFSRGLEQWTLFGADSVISIKNKALHFGNTEGVGNNSVGKITKI